MFPTKTDIFENQLYDTYFCKNHKIDGTRPRQLFLASVQNIAAWINTQFTMMGSTYSVLSLHMRVLYPSSYSIYAFQVVHNICAIKQSQFSYIPIYYLHRGQCAIYLGPSSSQNLVR